MSEGEIEVDVRFNTESAIKRHVTVVENVYYHRGPMENPEHYSESYAFEVSAELEDGCYTRRMKVGDDFTRLDSGWVEDIAFIMIHNHAGENLQTVPSPEEREAIKAQVVQVCFDGECFLIVRPGTDIRFTPLPGNSISLRCESGSTRISYTIVPR